jgi:hypothetical protein
LEVEMRRFGVVVAAAVVLAACSGGDDDAGVDETNTTTAPATTTTEPAGGDATTTTTEPADGTDATTTTTEPDDAFTFAGTIDLEVEHPDRCEVVGQECLLPFPSDALTVADESSATGRRVDIDAASLPSNSSGGPIDTSRLNRNDGFSPGSAALVLLPGVDPAASGLPPVTDIARSVEATSASVIVDATTGTMWPHWAEIDSNATDDARRGLFLRPAVNYPAGHRIVVGLRGLVDASGTPLEPTDAFRAYRDRLESDVPAVEARRDSMERVFDDLEAAGVDRAELVMAWEFTVISAESLAGPLLHMRDDAFGALGDDAPAFTVDSVEPRADEGRVVVEGSFDVPLYLTGDGTSGNGLNLADDPDLPTVNGVWSAPYRCQITDATSGAEPGAGMVYGHGLLGSERQVTSAGPTLVARNHNYVVCGTPLIGMAEDDVPNAVASLNDPSNFPTLVDRLLQGHLNTLFLGRLMKHPGGLVSDPAFRSGAGEPLIDTDELYYYGISQGGIMGPVSTAVSLDWDRGVFGVPAVNYSTLLNRSIDFDAFQQILDPAFPDKLDQALVILAIQMLWDRGEGNGYVSHFADPLPGTGPKYGLIQGALGDHQVANVAMDVMARSMQASVVWPAVNDGRSTDVEPFWGIPRIDDYPHDGSAVVMFDSGTPLPPITNTPPRAGVDPHEDVRRAAAAYDQIAAFLQPDGAIVDTCGGEACVIAPRG